ncbi:MAG: PDZ domain-containing protein [Myxococcota bacterium]
MRVVAMAAVVAVPQLGEPVGCSGGDDSSIDVTWTHPTSDASLDVDLLGCSGWDRDVANHRITLDAGWTSCAVQGTVSDGGLVVESEPMWIRGDEDVQVDFGLPVAPLGGMGARVASRGHGIALTEVLPGFPAESAGLLPGDVVLAVDDWSMRNATAMEFVRTVVGTPGTPVRLTVARKGTRYDVEIVRTRIPAQH